MSSWMAAVFYRKNRGLVISAGIARVNPQPVIDRAGDCRLRKRVDKRISFELAQPNEIRAWIIPTGDGPRHSRHHLSLLPSGPDEVRDRLLRGDQQDDPGNHLHPTGQTQNCFRGRPCGFFWISANFDYSIRSSSAFSSEKCRATRYPWSRR